MANKMTSKELRTASDTIDSPEAKTKSPFNNALELLREGRAANLNQTKSTADKFLHALELDNGDGNNANLKQEKPHVGNPVQEAKNNAKPGNLRQSNPAQHGDSQSNAPSNGDTQPNAPASGDKNKEPNAQPSNQVQEIYQSPFARTSEYLPSSRLREASDAIFTRVDTDLDGFLSKKELAAAVQDKGYRGQEAQAVAALYRNIDMFQNLHDDEWGIENDGITRKDMAEFDRLDAKRQNELNSLGDLSGWAQARLSSFDSDKNDKLSKSEIAAGLGRRDLDSKDKHALTYLKNNLNQVAAATNDGEWFWQSYEVSRNDINAQQNNILKYSDAARKIGSTNAIIDRTWDAQTPWVNRSLFADTEHPERSVTPDAIKQGYTGNCYFLAALAGVAQSDPQSVVRMIKDNGNGTYTVTFPGDKDHPVTVNAPTDAELGMFNAANPNGVWASVLEKAYGKYVSETQSEIGDTEIEAAGNGGRPSRAFKTLTGRDFRTELIALQSDETLVKTVNESFRTGKPITVMTSPSITGKLTWPWNESTTTSTDGFALQHVYTVTGIRPDGNGGHLVTIRNPWNKGNNTTRGTIEIPLTKFRKNFTLVVTEK